MTDRELWAVANHVLARDGEEGGRRFIAERIGELVLKGDMDGVGVWKLIAVRFDELAGGERGRH